MATILQTPGEYNLAFGINPVTLSGITGAQDKYVLQIRDRFGTTTWADVRQAPNAQGRALFDIQQILQNLLSPSPVGIEVYQGWVTGINETDEYRIYYGTETAGVATIDGYVSGRKVLSGRKTPADTTWASQVDYRYQISESGVCTVVDQKGLLLSDWQVGGLASGQGVSIPPRIAGGDQVVVQELRPTDAYSISFLQEPLKDGVATANNVSGAWVTSYDAGGNILVDQFIYNTTALGGGPDTTPLQNLAVVDPYWAMTLPCGPLASEVANEVSTVPGAAYYWVTLHTNTDSTCAASGLVWNTTTTQWEVETTEWDFGGGPTGGIADDPVFTPLLVKLTDGSCNDFEPIQLSWENSLGFRDYWTFAKRHDRDITIARNDYMQNPIDYNSSSVSVNAGSRGYRTFSQQLTNKYTVRTDWLTDAQAAYLENLFISPDVRANLGNGFISVTLLTTSYVEKTVRKDRMFQYELQFKTAYNITSQRG
jgi:hypothetical protein